MIATKKLLRVNRAWCSQCLDEWRNSEREIYEPLLWKIHTAKACPLHCCALAMVCPHCKKENPNFAARIVPGYCTACGKWLSDGVIDKIYSESDYELISSKAIGEMIAIAPSLQTWPSMENQKAFITWLLETKTTGGVRAFAKLIRVNNSYISHWKSGTYCMMMSNLAWICFNFRIPMVDVATLTFAGSDRSTEFQASQTTTNLVQPQNWVDWDSVELEMKDIICGVRPPTTVKDIASAYQCHVSGLYRRFPELCKKVSSINLEILQNEIASKYGAQYNDMKEHLQRCLASGTIPSKVDMYKKFGGHSRKRQALLRELFDEIDVLMKSPKST